MSEDNEFMAEETSVRIIPNFQHDVLRFITGNFGPFVPQLPVDVPLWLAYVLRKRKMCAIVPPDWLNVDDISTKSHEEGNNTDTFSTMPSHYQEVTALLIEVAGDDLMEDEGTMSISKLRESIEDFSRHRSSKIRQGMLAVSQQSFHDETTYSIKMNQVSAMEVASIRQQLLLSLEAFYDARPRAAQITSRDKRGPHRAPFKTKPAKRTLKRFH